MTDNFYLFSFYAVLGLEFVSDRSEEVAIPHSQADQ